MIPSRKDNTYEELLQTLEQFRHDIDSVGLDHDLSFEDQESLWMLEMKIRKIIKTRRAEDAYFKTERDVFNGSKN